MSLAFESMQRYAFAQIFCNGKKVLDAGCKFGYGTNYLAMTAKHVHGVDSDLDRIVFCDQNRGQINTSFQLHDLEKPILDTFDVVVALETIEHLGNPKNFIKQIPQIANTLIFSVPIGDRLRADGTRIEEHLQVFETETDVRSLIDPHLKVVFIGKQEPMSFIGVAVK